MENNSLLEKLYLDDLQVGQEFLSAEHPLDAKQIIAYAQQFDPQSGVVCGRGRNPTLRLWPTIFSGKIDVFPGDRRSRLISSMTSVARA